MARATSVRYSSAAVQTHPLPHEGHAVCPVADHAPRLRGGATLGLALLLVSTGACASTRWTAPQRPPHTASAEPEHDVLRLAVVARMDRLSAAAHWYDAQATKAHLKMRLMAVFSVMAASGAGAVAGVLAQPELPDLARPGLGAVGISAAALSGVFTLAPPAHHYVIKERLYRARAAEVRRSYGALLPRCGDSLTGSPEADPSALRRCLDDAEAAWVDALHPDDGDVAFLPDEATLLRWLGEGAAAAKGR